MKAGVEKEEAGNAESDSICLPKKTLPMRRAAFLEMDEHLPADGSNK